LVSCSKQWLDLLGWSPFFDIECCFKVVFFSCFISLSCSIYTFSRYIPSFSRSLVFGSNFPPLFTRSFVFSFIHLCLSRYLAFIYLLFFRTTLSTNRICLLRFAIFVQHSSCMSVQFGSHSTRKSLNEFSTAPSGPGPTHSRGFEITHNDAPQSVGLLSTSDQLVAEST
jgi:hypothetical protein